MTEPDLLAESPIWNLVAPDELVDRIAPDAKQPRYILDIEHRVRGRLFVVRWDVSRRDEIYLVRDH